MWWLYFRDGGRTHRRKIAAERAQAEMIAAQVNSQLSQQEPTLLTFTPISVSELRRPFLDYHEKVLHSAVGTGSRYRAATQYLESFVLLQDANVDPPIRQPTLGHRSSTRSGLGMTAKYAHTRPETQRKQIEAALRQWPDTLRLAAERSE